MGAISALRTSIGVLRRNPSLFVAAFLFSIVTTSLTGVQYVAPANVGPLLSLPLSVVSFLLTPLFLAGLYAMVHEGLAGRTSFATFADAARSNYLRLLGGYVLFAVVNIAAYVIAGIAIVVLVLFTVGFGAAGPSAGFGAIAGLVLAGFVLLLLAALPSFFLQFYGPGIVVNGFGIVESFERSYGLVRRNLLSTLGYNVVSTLVNLVTTLPIVLVALSQIDFDDPATTAPAPGAGGVPASVPTETLAVFVVATLAISTVVAAFLRTYHVAFYEDRLAASEPRSPGPDSAPVPGDEY